VVDHDVFADFGGFADDHPHAVVDEEPAADCGARVDLNAGQETAKLRYQPRREAQARDLPQAVRQPVDPDGMKP
jgi:hypothetical protein